MSKIPATLYLLKTKKLTKSFNDGHLVPVKRQVHRGGRVFEQTKYVLPADAQKRIVPGSVWQIKDQPGVHRDHANKHFTVLGRHEKHEGHYHVEYENGDRGVVHGSAILRHARPAERGTGAEHSPPPKQGAATDALPQFFSSEEVKHLDPRAVQPVRDKDELYKLGAEGLNHLKAWLNQGKGVCSRLGIKTMSGPIEETNWDQPGGMLFIAPLKSEKRAAEKVATDYEGDWSRLTDVVRASIAVDNLHEAASVLKELKENGLRLAKPPKDRFSNPTDVGYRDLLMNIRLPNGIIGELQVHVKPMLKAKELGHKPYEVMREIEGKYGAGGRLRPVVEWDADDYWKYRGAWEESVKIYGEAWSRIADLFKASNEEGGQTVMTDGKGYSYYEKDGAYFRRDDTGGHLGVNDILGADGWKPYTGDRLAPVYYGDRIEAKDLPPHAKEKPDAGEGKG